MIEKENGQKRPLIFLEKSRYKPDKNVIQKGVAIVAPLQNGGKTMQTANAYKNYENIQRIDALHTYAEWKRIENRRKARRRANAVYYIKQKLSGLILVIIGIIIPFVMDGDATASVLALPLGLYLLFTKEKAMDF